MPPHHPDGSQSDGSQGDGSQGDYQGDYQGDAYQSSADSPPGSGPDEVFNSTSGDFSFLVFFLVLSLLGGLTFWYMYRSRVSRQKKFAFFDAMEGSAFAFALPPTIDEYYVVKATAISRGWKPGQGRPSQEKTDTPGRLLGQALMKRAISVVPLVQRLQGEAAAMHRLHARNMCSGKQWGKFKEAEGQVGEEVEEVKEEAEEVRSGEGEGVETHIKGASRSQDI